MKLFRKQNRADRPAPSPIRIRGSVLVLAAVLLIVVSVVATFAVASGLYNARLKKALSNKIVLNDKTTDAYEVAKIQDVIDFIEENFGLEYDMNKLLEGAIGGLVAALGDPYSYYIAPGDYDAYEEYITGIYAGIGVMYLQTEQGLEITSVYGDTPAQRAGIAEGDTVTHIDGIAATDMTEEEIAERLSAGGRTVVLTVRHADGALQDYTVTVSQISRQTVYTRDEGNGVYYIRLTQFDDDAGTEFEQAIRDVQRSGVRGIILDLRNNGGGFEREASKVADLLLGEGVIAYAEDRNGRRISEIRSDAAHISVPIVLLVNGSTASASELVAGAFRDFDRGPIIGTQTFGKALGQLSRAYTADGSGLVLTVARYFTPSGECIHGLGITPDLVVEQAEEDRNTAPEDLPVERDLQLQRALAEIADLI